MEVIEGVLEEVSFEYHRELPFPVCEKSGKISYPSRDRARKAMIGLRAKLRIYFCRECHRHHLTKG